jgi:radical SAM superfamily enzyme YgiQ (UPF0313 family)
MSSILLVNPPSALGIYEHSRVKVGMSTAPFITLASLAGGIRDAGHEVRIADLMMEPVPLETFRRMLEDMRPDHVGITFTTPLYSDAKRLARFAREVLPGTVLVAGNVHATTFPEDVLRNGFDLVVLGEGERTIVDICDGRPPDSLKGVARLVDDRLVSGGRPDLIDDLDTLPLPAWDLFDLGRYHAPHIAARRNPVGYMETSRGCNHHCFYCSQTIFWHRIRFKSPERVVSEIFRMLDMGFKEIHMKDNNFTADIERAKTICRMLVDRRFDAPWALPTGVNVHDVDEEFFELARRAGCYQVAFGIESGDEGVLRRVNKPQSLERMRRAVEMASDAGMETLGNFMLGLPGETEETMQATIDFAASLPLTYAKASMTLPFPASVLYEQVKRDGRLLSEDWDRYNFHYTCDVWRHENLDWETIRRYYNRFHRRFYFRPSYVWKRFWRDVRMGQLIPDIRAALSNRWTD